VRGAALGGDVNLFTVIGILLTLAAALSYLNFRFLRLPPTIGLMLQSLLLSLALIGLYAAVVPLVAPVRVFLDSINFNEVLMHGMLSFLLFAGALEINLDDRLSVKLEVGLFATLGVAGSLVIVGLLLHVILDALGLPLPLMACLLFGALISPTDPVAVLSMLEHMRAPKDLENQIAGEALFNDGFGVVAFVVLLHVAGGRAAGTGEAMVLLAREAGGGLAFGLLLGWAGYLILKSVDDYPVEILITLAMVAGGYALAWELEISGPLAMVMAGLFIGNRGRRIAMSDKTRQNLDRFWELIDVFLNAVLFVLIGLEVLAISDTLTGSHLLAGAVAVPVVLVARLVSIGVPQTALRTFRKYPPRALAILTWAGLRGGIPVALALSLPHGHARDVLLSVTYVVVAFSILVQGTTVRPLIALAERKASDL